MILEFVLKAEVRFLIKITPDYDNWVDQLKICGSSIVFTLLRICKVNVISMESFSQMLPGHFCKYRKRNQRIYTLLFHIVLLPILHPNQMYLISFTVCFILYLWHCEVLSHIKLIFSNDCANKTILTSYLLKVICISISHLSTVCLMFSNRLKYRQNYQEISIFH